MQADRMCASWLCFHVERLQIATSSVNQQNSWTAALSLGVIVAFHSLKLTRRASDGEETGKGLCSAHGEPRWSERHLVEMRPDDVNILKLCFFSENEHISVRQWQSHDKMVTVLNADCR